MRTSLSGDLRKNLLCAGSSALMLAFAHVHAELWFLALFALVPFLWRLGSIDRRQAPLLGMMLATIYLVATSAGRLPVAPLVFLSELAALNTAFAVFGFAINRLSVRMGFNPVLIALIWFPLGLLLAQVVNLGDLLLIEQAGPELLLGFGSLAGILLWSSIFVLFNGLILLLARYFKRQLFRRPSVRRAVLRRIYIPAQVLPLSVRWAIIPSRRAPPSLS
ncbi:MAG: hypothetical protein OEV49_00580 [candidate division Zixibacteria bacterium]|nr:hypothetical protein [candidate division Zixibacteria bacterium]MDH3937022.1 hypothetical protein [candidate division Zixibacteria bacterium]MDH4032168.1 hypothetical protein [candidate division Zixibacteria bacterium]